MGSLGVTSPPFSLIAGLCDLLQVCCRMSLPSSALSRLKKKKAGKKLKTKVKEGAGLSADKGIIGQMY